MAAVFFCLRYRYEAQLKLSEAWFFAYNKVVLYREPYLMIRNVLILFVVISAMALAVVFAALNPGLVQLDLAFFEVELQKSLAFVLAFGVGALFGMVCALLMLLKLLNDRRSLRKALKLAEAEVISLREIPLNDAK